MYLRQVLTWENLLSPKKLQIDLAAEIAFEILVLFPCDCQENLHNTTGRGHLRPPHAMLLQTSAPLRISLVVASSRGTWPLFPIPGPLTAHEETIPQFPGLLLTPSTGLKTKP